MISGLIKLSYTDRLLTVYLVAHLLDQSSEDDIIIVQYIGKDVE
jgi:hypothetical protein